MDNFEKYGYLHNELMRRLEDGEITTETAKEVNDRLFDKYIVEGVFDKVKEKMDQRSEQKKQAGDLNLKFKSELDDVADKESWIESWTKQEVDHIKKLYGEDNQTAKEFANKSVKFLKDMHSILAQKKRLCATKTEESLKKIDELDKAWKTRYDEFWAIDVDLTKKKKSQLNK